MDAKKSKSGGDSVLIESWDCVAIKCRQEKAETNVAQCNQAIGFLANVPISQNVMLVTIWVYYRRMRIVRCSDVTIAVTAHNSAMIR